jgi:hypothetical protein
MRALLFGALLTLVVGSARADATVDKKRAALAAVHRLAIVAPFFSVDRLHKADASTNHAPPPDKPDAPGQETDATRLTAYQNQLHQLAQHVGSYLPERLKARTPYEIVSGDEIERALKALDLTPEKLFADGARMRNGRFPQPELETARRLAERLHADALLLTVLDEPRRTNGHYSFNPLSGIDYTSSHVGAHGGFYVVLPDGKEALHEFISVLHPLTHVGRRSYLLVDWQEALDLLVEDMLDDLTRYTPEKK